MTPDVCGNGVIGTGEVCDDANTTAWDGCDLSCQLESGYNCAQDTTPADGICDTTGTGSVVGITPPATPGTGPDLQSGSDTWPSNTDDITSDTTPTFDIVCTETWSTITLYADGTPQGTHICVWVGMETVTTSWTLADATYTITYTETDTTGNESWQSPELAVTIDTTDPVQPSCSTVPSPANNGTAITTTCTSVESGAVVMIPDMNCTPSPADGTWIVTCTWTVGTGVGEVSTSDDTVTVTDPAGNTNTDETTGLDIDTIAPAIPTTTPDLQPGSDTWPSNTDDITSDVTPSFDVICTETGSIITLYVDGIAQGSHVCAGVGTETATISPALVDWNYTITYTETDTAGNESGASPGLSITIDTSNDQDGDGLLDTDEDVNGNSDPTDDDSDGDGTPDYLDPDDDNDGRVSNSEGTGDLDNDGLPNYRDPDDDGDNVLTLVEDSWPNTGDGNDDGSEDSQQPHVTTIPDNDTDSFYTIVIPVAGTCSRIDNFTATQESLQPEQDVLVYPLGLNEFVIPCASSVDITVYYHQEISLTPYTYKKYGPLVPGDLLSQQWYVLNDVTPVTIGSQVVGGNTVATVSFTLTDGQPGDDTGVDGFIIDANGPGILPATTPSRGWGSSLAVADIPFAPFTEEEQQIIEDILSKKENTDEEVWPSSDDERKLPEWLELWVPTILPKTGASLDE